MNETGDQLEIFRSIQSFAHQHWTRDDVESGATLGSKWGAVDDLGIPAIATSEDRGGLAGQPELVGAALRSLGHALLPEEIMSHMACLRLLESIDPGLLDHLGQAKVALHLPGKDDTLAVKGGPVSGKALIEASALEAERLVFFAKDDLGGGWYWAPGKNFVSSVRETVTYTDKSKRHRIDAKGVAAERIADASAETLKSARLVKAAFELCYMAGLAEAICAQTGQYAQTRKQFGKSLDAFQAVQLRLADIVQIAYSIKCWSEEALAAVLSGRPDAERTVAMAMSFVADNIDKLAYDGHRIHGGVGYTIALDLYFYTCRAFFIGARFKMARPLQYVTPSQSAA